MVARIAILALGAVCCLFSGCGCSKEKADAGIPARMEDAAYTNRLVQLRADQTAVAAKAAALRGKLAQLSQDARGAPEYIDLTNRLAQCTEEAERLRKAALNVIRTRLMKESAQKGNFKK